MSIAEIVLGFILVTALSAAGKTFAADEEAVETAAQEQETIRVLDLSLLPGDKLALDTNTMSLAAATNLIHLRRDSFDAIVVHGAAEDGDAAEKQSSMLARIARAGVPLMFVEKDGEYSWRDQSGGGVRTVKLGTDHVAALRRLWADGPEATNAPSRPVLQTTFGDDTADGTYRLEQIDLGLFGERVWIMHRPGDADSEPGSFGIQLKREW